MASRIRGLSCVIIGLTKLGSTSTLPPLRHTAKNIEDTGESNLMACSDVAIPSPIRHTYHRNMRDGDKRTELLNCRILRKKSVLVVNGDIFQQRRKLLSERYLLVSVCN